MFFFSSLRSSNSCPDIYRNAISGGGAKAKVLTALAEDSNECSSRCSNSCDSCLHSLVDHLPMAGLASWKKFCNAPFVLFLVSNFILYAFYDIMYTFMPDYAVGDLKVNISHCSNPEIRIRKKLQERSEAAVRMPLERASKRAPT